MTLQQLSKTVDFVQATTPSNANDGETWLDTSLSPPQLKVFDGSAGTFIEPRSIQNLDVPVSSAGASTADIESGAENALEEDIANMSPASNSVAGQLNGGVSGGTDLSLKTPDFIRLPIGNNNFIRGADASSGATKTASLTLISGSGFIDQKLDGPTVEINVEHFGSSEDINGTAFVRTVVDGQKVEEQTQSFSGQDQTFTLGKIRTPTLAAFNSSVEFELKMDFDSSSTSGDTDVNTTIKNDGYLGVLLD